MSGRAVAEYLLLQLLRNTGLTMFSAFPVTIFSVSIASRTGVLRSTLALRAKIPAFLLQTGTPAAGGSVG